MAVTELNDETFGQAENGLVVVDFYAEWCGPCKMLEPVMDKASDEIDEVNFFAVNVDDAPGTARKFRVSSIPTVVFMKDGKVLDTVVGLMTFDTLKKRIDNVIKG